MATRALEIVITGDPDSFSRASRQVERDAKRMGDRVDREGGRIRGFATVTSKGFGRVGLAAGGMAAAGVGAAALMAKKFVEGASDINESLSKNRVLFGQYAKDVNRFSRTSAESFGISRQAALEYTGVFGNLFRALGETQKHSAGMSVRLTKLAADMASFNNTSIEDALEAIRSGITGETEPLRRFGVNIQDATLRQQAMADGLTKTTKNVLTPHQKALAAVALITKQTANAHGDFARTSNGLANQQRILTAQLSDTTSQLGGKLVPAALAGVRALNSLFDSNTQGGRAVQRLGDMTRQAGQAIIRAYDAVVAAVRRFAQRNREDIDAVVQAVKNYGRFVRNVVEDVIIPFVKRVAPIFREMVAGIVQVLRGLIRIVTGIVNGDWSRVWAGFKDIFKGAVHAIVADIKGLAGLIKDGIKALAPIALNAAKAVGRAIVNGIVAGVKAAPGAIKDAITGAVGSAIDAVGGFITGGGGGDGVGKIVGNLRALSLPQGGAFGGSLFGARPEMRPFAAIGAGMGLTVSSGRTNHNVMTTSGNVSFHSTGEAIDMVGPMAGMHRYAQLLHDRFGPRLAELISPWPALNLKSGHAYAYDARTQAEHRDHVHVAFDSGRPGVGDGKGKDQQVITSAAARGGIDPSILYGVWGAESTFSHGPGPVSPAGAIGPFQLMPDTARGLGVNPRDFVSSAGGAARYLGQYKGRGVSGMLAAYNAGPAGNPNNSETQKYIPRVLRYAKQWSGGAMRGGSGGAGGSAGPVIGNLGIVSGGWSGGPGPRAVLPNAFGSKGLIEEVTASTNLAVARYGGDERANPARREQISAIRTRMQKIRQALRKPGMSRGVRIRLENELAELITTARQLGEDITASIPTPPTASDFAQNRLAVASLTPDTADDLSALENIRDVAGRNLAKARRTADPVKITEAINNFKQASDAVDEFKKQLEPTADDMDRMRQAQAALTDTLEDDLDVAKGIAARRAQEYQAALATGDPRAIADAAEALKQATDNVKGIADAITQATPTPRDYNDLAQAMAGLTDTLDDDVQAARDRVALDEEALKQAQNTPGIADDIEAATNLKGSRDQLKSLEDAIKQSDAQRQQEEETRKQLLQANTDALNGVRDEIKRGNDIANATLSTSDFQLRTALANIMSGQLGAMTLRRSFTPGAPTGAFAANY